MRSSIFISVLIELEKKKKIKKSWSRYRTRSPWSHLPPPKTVRSDIDHHRPLSYSPLRRINSTKLWSTTATTSLSEIKSIGIGAWLWWSRSLSFWSLSYYFSCRLVLCRTQWTFFHTGKLLPATLDFLRPRAMPLSSMPVVLVVQHNFLLFKVEMKVVGTTCFYINWMVQIKWRYHQITKPPCALKS